MWGETPRGEGADLADFSSSRPHDGAKVGRLICDVVKPDGVPYEGDPRFVLRQALERMKALGFDTFNVGPELEYFLFEDSEGTKTLDEGGYFAMTAQDAATEVRNDTIAALESVGIDIEYHHHEVAPSQHEIDMRFDSALSMADKTLTYRLVVKEVAAWHGYYATFMPKPLFGENGSGMHTHMSLFKDGRNTFFDAKDPHNLSKTAKSFKKDELRPNTVKMPKAPPPKGLPPPGKRPPPPPSHRGVRYMWGGLPFLFYDGYYHGDCSWLRRKARETGSSYWWRRYRQCRDD